MSTKELEWIDKCPVAKFVGAISQLQSESLIFSIFRGNKTKTCKVTSLAPRLCKIEYLNVVTFLQKPCELVSLTDLKEVGFDA